MPPLVLLDATPLRGPGCDRADRAYARGLLGAFVDQPERGPASVAARRGYLRSAGGRRARSAPVTRGTRPRAGCLVPARPPVAEIGAADLARLTSTAPIAAPRQIATCLDLPGLRFPAIAFGARASWRRFNGCLDRVASARLVIVPTGRVAVEVTDLLGIPESRIRVITPGAPPITAPGPVTHHPPIVLLVANRKPDANAALGVRALALTDPRHEPRAVIVGVDDRRRRERLRRLAGALGASARTTLSRSPVAARLADLRRTATIAPVPSYAAGVSVRVLAALDRDAADETWACNLEASDA